MLLHNFLVGVAFDHSPLIWSPIWQIKNSGHSSELATSPSASWFVLVSLCLLVCLCVRVLVSVWLCVCSFAFVSVLLCVCVSVCVCLCVCVPVLLCFCVMMGTFAPLKRPSPGGHALYGPKGNAWGT